jgi:hypothetical protein
MSRRRLRIFASSMPARITYMGEHVSDRPAATANRASRNALRFVIA